MKGQDNNVILDASTAPVYIAFTFIILLDPDNDLAKQKLPLQMMSRSLETTVVTMDIQS